jgi:hypothetical protein
MRDTKATEAVEPLFLDSGFRQNRVQRTAYKISQKEAAAVLEILQKPGTIINRLEQVLEIRTGNSRGLIGQGFRNDIEMMIKAAK